MIDYLIDLFAEISKDKTQKTKIYNNNNENTMSAIALPDGLTIHYWGGIKSRGQSIHVSIQ